jgi:multimeric flavodoxin WrbA
MDADAIVYATPLYWFSFSAQIKPLIDRHVCLLKGVNTPEYKSLIADKPVALLVTCDDPAENNAEAIQTIFDRKSAYCATKVVGKYILANCGTEGALNKQAPDVAKTMAADFSKYLK